MHKIKVTTDNESTATKTRNDDFLTNPQNPLVTSVTRAESFVKESQGTINEYKLKMKNKGTKLLVWKPGRSG